MFNAPANIGDFSRGSDPGRLSQGWHKQINAWTQKVASESIQYYNPNVDTGGQDQGTQDITWNGFPQTLTAWFGEDKEAALRASEILVPFTYYLEGQGNNVRRQMYIYTSQDEFLASNFQMQAVVNGNQLGDRVDLFFRPQDEYCEWHVSRDSSGTVEKIDFTAENPEYWDHLASDENLLVTLYRELVGQQVTAAELFWQHPVAAWNVTTRTWQIVIEAGEYNPYNRWNTTHGAVHLTQPNNSLQAEINLGADAAVVYDHQHDPNSGLTEAQSLIGCAGYGGVNRSSDPLIGFGVQSLAQLGLAVTIANPVGLYIQSIDIAGLRGPNGETVGNAAVHYIRQSEDKRFKLRAEIKVPTEQGFKLGDCSLDGKLITSGGQIAKHANMFLVGQAKSGLPLQNNKKACVGKLCEHPHRPGFFRWTPKQSSCSGISMETWRSSGPFNTDVSAVEVLSAEFSKLQDGISADRLEPEHLDTKPEAIVSRKVF